MSSRTRSYSSADSRYQIVIPGKVEQKIIRLCAAARGRETGGVLLGRYTTDRTTAILTDVTPPPKDSKAGYYWFHRGVAGLQRLLSRLWSKTHREYYLGEWHHHPVEAVAPSTEDILQMKRISEDEGYRCPEPVLIIVGVSRYSRWNGRVFLFPRGGEHIELGVSST